MLGQKRKNEIKRRLVHLAIQPVRNWNRQFLMPNVSLDSPKGPATASD